MGDVMKARSPDPCRRGRWLFAAVATSAMLAATGARAGVDITVKWNAAATEVRPAPREVSVPVAYSYHLSGRNNLTIRAANGFQLKATLGHTAQFGDAAGQVRQVNIRIVNGAMMFTVPYPSFSVVLTIRSDGTSSCEANVQYKIRPGHTFFELPGANGETMQFIGAHAENASCAIQPAGD
jgi:hypothetical protein